MTVVKDDANAAAVTATAPVGLEAKGKSFAWRSTIQAVGMLPVLVLLGIAFELMSGRFLSWQNL
jgi:ribose transport system permease protein